MTNAAVWLFKSLPVIAVLLIVWNLLEANGLGLGIPEDAPQKARMINCAGNLKQIGLALMLYREAHGGEWPDQGLWQLDVTGDLLAGKVYRCPSVARGSFLRAAPRCSAESLRAGDEGDYVYLGLLDAAIVNGLSEIPLATEKASNHVNHYNVLFADGHVMGYSAESWQALKIQEGW